MTYEPLMCFCQGVTRNKEYFIPTNFNIPAGYKRKFVFRGKSGVMTLERAGRRKLRFSETGDVEGRFTVEGEGALDWIQETIEMIRFDSEQ